MKIRENPTRMGPFLRHDYFDPEHQGIHQQMKIRMERMDVTIRNNWHCRKGLPELKA